MVSAHVLSALILRQKPSTIDCGCAFAANHSKKSSKPAYFFPANQEQNHVQSGYLQLISLLCIGIFLHMIRQHDSTVMIRPRGYQAHRSNRKIMKVLHEDLRWRVIYHQYLYGSSIKETANVLFTSTAFVSKIRRLYRQRGEVNRKRRTGRQRILSCKLVFVLFMFFFLNNIC